MMKHYLFLLLMVFVGSLELGAQNTGFYAVPDTVQDVDIEYIPGEKAKIFSGRPGRAALYSLILPGAGQAYNEKYWQVPIVWGVVGTVGVFMDKNIKEYKKLRDHYHDGLVAEINGTEPPAPLKGYIGLSNAQIKNERDKWNRYRQTMIFAFSLTWIANSAQAYVGAHLKDFDVSDDLSIQFMPIMSGDEFDPVSTVASGVIVRF